MHTLVPLLSRALALNALDSASLCRTSFSHTKHIHRRFLEPDELPSLLRRPDASHATIAAVTDSEAAAAIDASLSESHER